MSSELTFALHAACYHLVFPQTHHSIGANIGPINGNAETLGWRNGFAPGFWPVVLGGLDGPLFEPCTNFELWRRNVVWETLSLPMGSRSPNAAAARR